MLPKDISVGETVVVWRDRPLAKLKVTSILKNSLITEDDRRWTKDGKLWGTGSDAWLTSPRIHLRPWQQGDDERIENTKLEVRRVRLADQLNNYQKWRSLTLPQLQAVASIINGAST